MSIEEFFKQEYYESTTLESAKAFLQLSYTKRYNESDLETFAFPMKEKDLKEIHTALEMIFINIDKISLRDFKRLADKKKSDYLQFEDLDFQTLLKTLTQTIKDKPIRNKLDDILIYMLLDYNHFKIANDNFELLFKKKPPLTKATYTSYYTNFLDTIKNNTKQYEFGSYNTLIVPPDFDYNKASENTKYYFNDNISSLYLFQMMEPYGEKILLFFSLIYKETQKSIDKESFNFSNEIYRLMNEKIETTYGKKKKKKTYTKWKNLILSNIFRNEFHEYHSFCTSQFIKEIKRLKKCDNSEAKFLNSFLRTLLIFFIFSLHFRFHKVSYIIPYSIVSNYFSSAVKLYLKQEIFNYKIFKDLKQDLNKYSIELFYDLVNIFSNMTDFDDAIEKIKSTLTNCDNKIRQYVKNNITIVGLTKEFAEKKYFLIVDKEIVDFIYARVRREKNLDEHLEIRKHKIVEILDYKKNHNLDTIIKEVKETLALNDLRFKAFLYVSKNKDYLGMENKRKFITIEYTPKINDYPSSFNMKKDIKFQIKDLSLMRKEQLIPTNVSKDEFLNDEILNEIEQFNLKVIQPLYLAQLARYEYEYDNPEIFKNVLTDNLINDATKLYNQIFLKKEANY